jgi:hypothetical protein
MARWVRQDGKLITAIVDLDFNFSIFPQLPSISIACIDFFASTSILSGHKGIVRKSARVSP